MELKKALCTAHEKFCFWPDSPCPGGCLGACCCPCLALIPFYSLSVAALVSHGRNCSVSSTSQSRQCRHGPLFLLQQSD